jgi:hypothetical protein
MLTVRRLERDLEAFSADAGKLGPALKRRWLEAQPLARKQAAALRWCVIGCFALIEAYLSGLAWRVQQSGGERLNAMSTKDRKIIEDTGSSFRTGLSGSLVLWPAARSGTTTRKFKES